MLSEGEEEKEILPVVETLSIVCLFTLPGRKTGEGDDLGPVSKVCMCYVPLFSRGEASGTKLSFAAAV